MFDVVPRDCKHGYLGRACEICDLEAEVAALRRARRDLGRRTHLAEQRARMLEQYAQAVLDEVIEERVCCATCLEAGKTPWWTNAEERLLRLLNYKD